MEFFHNAKTVRLKSHHKKYLLVQEGEESVIQDRNGSSKNARWTVEHVPGSDSIIRLKSAYNKYLTASNQPFLLGMTGSKVLQALPQRLDSSVEWEPVREGSQVKLKTVYGQFLRANGGLPPWRNSVTHDIPQRTATQDWVLWDVDIVEIQGQPPAAKPTASKPMASRPPSKPTASRPTARETHAGYCVGSELLHVANNDDEAGGVDENVEDVEVSEVAEAGEPDAGELTEAADVSEGAEGGGEAVGVDVGAGEVLEGLDGGGGFVEGLLSILSSI